MRRRGLLILSAALAAVALAGCWGSRPERAAGSRDGSAPGAGALAEHAGHQLPADGPVRVRRVTLFSSGVGFIEEAGQVTGAATTAIAVRKDQIDDLLKSLVVEDDDGGTVAGLDFPSADPLARTLASFAVDLGALGAEAPLAQLLIRLRGTPATARWQDMTISGTILGAELHTETIGAGPRGLQRWMLQLLQPGGVVRQMPMDEIQVLQLDDRHLQDELARALAAISRDRARDQGAVAVAWHGTGLRRVRLGYCQECPVWKTSYRLILPARADDHPMQARIQGWAIVENQSDQDWRSIRLSLVSGRPISFIQELSRPEYLPRPRVARERFTSLVPETDEGGLPLMAGQAATRSQAARPLEETDQESEAMDAAPTESAVSTAATAAPGMPSNGVVDTRSVAAQAVTESVGTQIAYTLADPVSVPRQHAAMLPIISGDIRAERVSIYDPQVDAVHALDGAVLTNTTGGALLQGPVTVFAGGGYAGDARIDDLPPGDHRLLSYAMDLPVRIDAVSQGSAGTITTATISDGVLTLGRRAVRTQVLDITVADQQPRQLVVQLAVEPGWDLVGTPPPWETIPGIARWRITLTGAAQRFVIRREHLEIQRIALSGLDERALASYQGTTDIPAPVRAALAQLAVRSRAVADAHLALERAQQRLAAIVQDQARVRENLGASDRRSAYAQRLMARLAEQEDRIDALGTSIAAVAAGLAEQQRQLAAAIGALQCE